jgi:hypothetical protein
MNVFFHGNQAPVNDWFPTSRGSEARAIAVRGLLDKVGNDAQPVTA